ncbi:hypothetical protein HPB47_002497 [Ixodes persulcatus]|uniref:Uncharacterized protein n=1 Tax=Ixodes persulcatus TaxID=34615 RepID=A0AC60PMA6_IXOPE|nr:hypothetical protein HPB47_002497 [Ixodes persulcatus]
MENTSLQVRSQGAAIFLSGASRPRAGSAGRAEVPAGSMLLSGSRPGACSESPGSRPGPSLGSHGVSARSGTGHRTHIRRTGQAACQELP